MRGFARVAAAVPHCSIADVGGNVAATVALWRQAHEEGCALVVFPELGLSGYTVRDLFHDRHLLDGVEQGLLELARHSADFRPMAVVGAPLRFRGGLFNVAVAIQGGKFLAAVPKAYLPSYGEFEEQRWFRSGFEVAPATDLQLGGCNVPFGLDVLLQADGFQALTVGLEVCEDAWVHAPPSAAAMSAGATVIANLSASNFVVGKAELRRLLIRSASDRGKCAYLYTAAGPGESSTDLAFDADAFICENGHELASSRRFSREPQLVSVDIDVESLLRERMRSTSFLDCSQRTRQAYRVVRFSGRDHTPAPLRRTVARHPFVPADPATLDERCWEIFEIQTNALATRLAALGRPRPVLGLSGGLDSTHAALVCAGALDLLGWPRKELLCVTMPGLGTSARTRANAGALAVALGAELVDLSISELSLGVLGLVEHGASRGVSNVEELMAQLRARPDLADVTFENVQARLRTLLLMTEANRVGGLVIGTGDLSEKALGWSTYGGDQISMYDVNAGVPKTLIQFVIRWVAKERAAAWAGADPQDLQRTLAAVLDTPISPELLPLGEEGAVAQLSEAALGPYELHDFFLYHFIRHGQPPARILDLARAAFGSEYDVPTLKAWLRRFLARFFAQQFKRSCTADGPKVGQVALSPRGDWRMPSDAQVQTWLSEVDGYEAVGL